jgi:hypothetical protein
VKIHMRKLPSLLTVTLLIVGVFGLARTTAGQEVYGDVFVSVRNTVQEYTPTGTLVQTLYGGLSCGYYAGPTFDPAGNFYVTDFSCGGVSEFNNMGALVTTDWASNPAQPSPESITYNATTNTFFVGGPFVPSISEYNTSGSLIHTFFVSLVGHTGGTDWLTFQNPSTILYLGEGYGIDSLNITTGANTLFATIPTYSWALRVIPSGAFAGDVLVAGSTAAYLLGSTGNLIQTYSLPGNDGVVFALNLDPNGTDFWTCDTGGDVWKVNIATGAIDEQWSTGSGPSTTFGLAVFGEPTPVSGAAITNQSGTIAISNMAGTGGLGTIGSTTITSHDSELTNFDGIASSKPADLGRVNFTTGTLSSGSVSGGGVFSPTGSSFAVIGRGKWLAGLPGTPVGTVTLFTGAFVGPINWTFVSQDGAKLTYTLSGNVTGVSNGESVTGTTVQNFYTSDGQLVQGIAHIVVGTSELTY